MKNFFLSIALAVVAACSTMAPVLVPTEGAVLRQVERVVERHDAYVRADDVLTSIMIQSHLDQSEAVRKLMASPGGVSASMLAPRLAPVLDRHDHYISFDGTLDELTRDTYLGTTSGLRALLVIANPLN